MIYKLTKGNEPLFGIVDLPRSKSISNRLLIMQALYNGALEIKHLSDANDTKVLQRLLKEVGPEFDAEDAGTAFRFLTAYLAMREGQWVLTGTERMKKRPIKILVRALQDLGIRVRYLDEIGYPPIAIQGGNIRGGKVLLDASVSSQYVSALMLIASQIPEGLEIHLTGKISSRPYIEMTARLLESSGIAVHDHGNFIQIHQQDIQPSCVTVECDWSAASYYFLLAAFQPGSSIKLPGLFSESIQGDAVVQELMKPFGVVASESEEGIELTSTGEKPDAFEFDFSGCPDLVQTMAVLCAARKVPAKFLGTYNLRIKETDRILALRTELAKIGAILSEVDDVLELEMSHTFQHNPPLRFSSWNDHRMAMAFAPLVMIYDEMLIEDPQVVQKSNPKYWEHLADLGIQCQELSGEDS